MACNPQPRTPAVEENDKSDAPISREECIAEIHRVFALEPDAFLSRTRFRAQARIKDVVWNRHFGTFTEFKRGAGIELTRHQHRMELDVAKHSSVESFRALNGEKQGWEDRYLRPSGARFQTILHFTDVHDVECDPFWRRCLMETALRVQPEKVIIGGDLFDLPEFGKYSVDPREWDVVGRIRWVHAFLRDLRDACPSAEIVLIEGNHEFRLLRHLAEATPAMRAVLSDLHGFTVSRLLGLDEFEINYISRTDLGVFSRRDISEELNRNYFIAHDCYLAHHFPEGEKMGYPGAHGHHHRHSVSQHFSPGFGVFEWHQLGCGHRRLASYTPGEQWGMGFLLAHIDTVKKHVAHEYINIQQDFAMIGGRFYERESSEQSHSI